MSAGELFELVMPAAYVASALLSTLVLASARKRFELHFAFALALATFFLPVVIFPLYLAVIIWRKADKPPQRWRYTLPLLYLAIVLLVIRFYVY